MAFAIDRVDWVDLLAYAAEDAHVRDAASMLSVPLASAAAYYLRETVPDRCDEPLTLACWEPGHDLVIEDGTDLLPELSAEAQVYATARRRSHPSEMAAPGVPDHPSTSAAAESGSRRTRRS